MKWLGCGGWSVYIRQSLLVLCEWWRCQVLRRMESLQLYSIWSSSGSAVCVIIAICHLDGIIISGRRVFILHREVLLSVCTLLLDQEGQWPLGIVAGGLLCYNLLQWGCGRVFLQIICSITSCYFAPNIFIGVWRKYPSLLWVGELIRSGDLYRDRWHFESTLMQYGLGCQLRSRGPGSQQCVLMLMSPR